MSHPTIHITAATHISPQQPLSEQWLECPTPLPLVAHAVDPDFKQWLNPMKSRRWDALLKRALVTSRTVMQQAGVTMPDAIITGTGMGCLGSTSAFLSALAHEGESVSQPTHFMQSTHNTIGSLIAMQTGCHGYNTTHSQGSMSMDTALLDAITLLQTGMAQHALVGSHDQLLDEWVQMLRHEGDDRTMGEVSVAMMLEAASDLEQTSSLCTLAGITLSAGNMTDDALRLCGTTPPDAIMTSGNCARGLTSLPFPNVPRLCYGHMCGAGYSASAFGVYATAQCLHRHAFPAHMRCDGHNTPLPANRVLVVNEDTPYYSLILLVS